MKARKYSVCFVTACGQTDTTKTSETEATVETLSWQNYYDLGMKYLNEGNYEEAIIAFAAAIEIESKTADAYLGLAGVYIAQNDFDAAIAILEQGLAESDDEVLQARLDELYGSNVSDFWGTRARCLITMKMVSCSTIICTTTRME